MVGQYGFGGVQTDPMIFHDFRVRLRQGLCGCLDESNNIPRLPNPTEAGTRKNFHFFIIMHINAKSHACREIQRFQYHLESKNIIFHRFQVLLRQRLEKIFIFFTMHTDVKRYACREIQRNSKPYRGRQCLNFGMSKSFPPVECSLCAPLIMHDDGCSLYSQTVE